MIDDSSIPTLNKNELIDFLRKTPLLSALSTEDLTRISGSLTVKSVAVGATIYDIGDAADALYFIQSGMVRLLITTNRRELELYRLQNGDYFGLYGLLSDSTSVEKAVAVLDCVLLCIERTKFLDFMNEIPKLAATAAVHVSKNISGIVRGLHQNKTRVQTSNINTIVLTEAVCQDQGFVDALLTEIFSLLNGDALVVYSNIHTTMIPAKNLSVSHPHELVKDVLLERGDKGVYAANWPDMEQSQNIDEISIWLRNESKKYQFVFLLTTPGGVNFLKFSLGICGRSVCVAKNSVPEFVQYLKPGRDRFYLVDSGSRVDDLVNYKEALSLLKDNAICMAPHSLKTDKRYGAGIVARWLTHKSVGIAFGGGGARALAHNGVLEVLESQGVLIDAVSGSSAGAITAGMVAKGWNSQRMIETLTHLLINVKGHPFSDYTLPFISHSLARGKKAIHLLKRIFDEQPCFATKLAFFPIATNMINGHQVILREMPIWKAIIASGTAPGIFPLVQHEGMYLADGGLVNNVPASVLRDYGCDLIISINISVDPANNQLNPKSILNVMLSFLDIVMDQSVQKYRDSTDLEIMPKVDGYGVLDYQQGLAIINIGKVAMTEKLAEYRALKLR